MEIQSGFGEDQSFCIVTGLRIKSFAFGNGFRETPRNHQIPELDIIVLPPIDRLNGPVHHMPVDERRRILKEVGVKKLHGTYHRGSHTLVVMGFLRAQGAVHVHNIARGDRDHSPAMIVNISRRNDHPIPRGVPDIPAHEHIEAFDDAHRAGAPV